MVIKVYNGYGHKQNLVVYGHVLASLPQSSKKLTNNFLINTWHIIRLFFVKPIANIKVRLQWREQVLETITEEDGFFKFEWASHTPTPAGWHALQVSAFDNTGNEVSATGNLFVPHTTQYVFISDIDDTVIVSHSATIFRRLRVLFFKNSHTRKAFVDVVQHYTLLAAANTKPGMPNPFFYVSSSEWNLYDYLEEFFRFNRFPGGTFLLSQLKQWYNLLRSGQTKHQGKQVRIMRVLANFLEQQFILLGDNSQHDPDIYYTIAMANADKIFAVYIRNVHEAKAAATRAILQQLEAAGIHTCFYEDSSVAIAHSKQIGLIK